MEKERSPERREPPPAERDDVRVAGSRCPYCHEAVARESADVCRDCLARHHAACWAEAPRCGACGSEEVLRPVARDPVPARGPLSPGDVRAIVADTLRSEGFAVEPQRSRCMKEGCALPALDGRVRCGSHHEELRRFARRFARVSAHVEVGLALLLLAVSAVEGLRSGAWGWPAAGALVALALLTSGALVLRRLRRLSPLPPA